VNKGVDHEKEITEGVEVLGIKHARCYASESANISESVRSDEDTVKVPGAKENDNVEKPMEHVRSSEVRIWRIVSSGLIAMRDNEEEREKNSPEGIDDDERDALVERGPVYT
jgi:hypothetical protein